MTTATITASQVKQLRDATQAGMMDAKKALVETNGDFDAAVTLLREKGIAKAGKLGSRDVTEGRVGIASNGHAGALVEVGCNTDFVSRNDDFGRFVDKVAGHVLQHKTQSVEELLTQEWADGGTVEDARAAAATATGENVNITRIAFFDANPITGDQQHGVLGQYIHGTGIGVIVDVAGPDVEEVHTFATDVAMHAAAAAPQYLTRDEVPQDKIDAERDIFLKQLEGENKPEAIRGKIAEGKLNKWFGEIALVEQPWIFAKDRVGKDLTIEQYAADVAEKVGQPVSVRAYARFAIKG
ncbi:MAG: elongation factor Ts [Thermoleophilia bacterium]|nr:elongation factor Ts [Thermoleophilia bacterium]